MSSICRGVYPSSLALTPKNPCPKPERLGLGSLGLVATWASCSLFSLCGLSQRKWEKQPAVLPPPLPRRSSGGDNEPFTHSQLQVLLVTLPICCHGCLAQEQLGELIHGPLSGNCRSPWIVAAPLSAHVCLSGRRSGLAQPLGSRRCQAGTRCLFSDSLGILPFQGSDLSSLSVSFSFCPLVLPGCGGSPGGDPNALWVPRRAFPWSHARLGSSGRAAKPNSTRDLPPFFLAKTVLVTPAIKLSGLTDAVGSPRPGNKRAVSAELSGFTAVSLTSLSASFLRALPQPTPCYLLISYSLHG